MNPITVINHLVIKPGKMDEFVELQRTFAAALPRCGLIGGRMYRSVDGRSAVLVSCFESMSAQEAVQRRPEFRDHLTKLQPLVESSSPAMFEEAYTYKDFK